ncbi:MAG: glycosyl hydrolase, partial [bacterium]
MTRTTALRCLTAFLLACVVPSALAQRLAPAKDTTARLAASAFPNLRWRNIGPFRGGRSVAAAGSFVEPRTFYFGAVNGGVWKTTNAGASWANITDFRVKGNAPEISSIGAIAIAPSDPNVIWVGTGESGMREDLTYGTGVYRSTDAGESWTHVGLDDSQQIGAVRVHPGNPDIAYVAAFGHAFGPNKTRGVYKTIDGGKTWAQSLFVDDSTGAIDLALDPSNPRILYAAMWHLRRFPWGMHSGGGHS